MNCCPNCGHTITDALSEREEEIARLAANGLSNKEIGRKLGISPGTVKMHVHNALAKLRLRSRWQLDRVFS